MKNFLILIVTSIFLISIGLFFEDTQTTLSSAFLLIGTGLILYSLFILPIINLIKFLKKVYLKSYTDKENDKPVNKNIEPSKTKEIENMSNTLNIDDNVIIVSISKSIESGNDIYNAARFSWKLDSTKLKDIDYVMARQGLRIVGVFKVHKWLPDDDHEFKALNPELSSNGRFGFVGEVADSETLLKYFNKDLPANLFPKGASNPVRYIFGKDAENPTTESTSDNSIIDESDEAGTPEMVFHRILISQNGNMKVNLIYAEVGGEDYETMGAFSGGCGGGGLFLENNDGIAVTDDFYEFESRFSYEELETIFSKLEKLRAEFEDFNDDGDFEGITETGIKFISEFGEDTGSFIIAMSSDASDDYILDIQDDWNLNFYYEN